MLRTGDLVHLHGYLERKDIGMVMRYNLRYNSYTIYWIKTGEICAKCTYDVVKL
jgi:hypothetical protein